MSMALNVAIDGRPLVGERTGIGVHTAEIASRLDVDPPPLIASHAPITDRTGIEACRFDVTPARLGVVWQQMLFPGVAARADADVVWGPHGTLPLRLARPSVITIHDLTALTMPRRHRLRTVASFDLFIGRSLEKASRIAAVSRTTADELMRRFGVELSRIEIVPNGVDQFFSPAAEGIVPLGLERHRYILFAGTIEPRKGVDDLVTAWEALRAPRPKLVLAGGKGWGHEALRERIDRLTARGEVLAAGFVDRPTLRDLYRHALLFVYPSHHEGFGIPPLEAMACGCPVIATDRGALPEVLGDAAILVRAGRPDDLRSAMERVGSDAALRDAMSSRGTDHAALFRWEASAEKMTALLAEAAKS